MEARNGKQAGTNTTWGQIPDELKARRQWVVWRLEKLDKPTKDGKTHTKVPYQTCVTAKSNYQECPKAKANTPATWTTYERANDWLRNFDGIGFEMSADDPYTSIDLDECRDADTGAIAEWAMREVERFNSYTEISPSGRGLHIWIRGTIADGDGHKRGRYEAYSARHFLTMTGQRLNGTPATIAERQDELAAFCAEHFGPKMEPVQQTTAPRPAEPVRFDDAALIVKMQNAADGPKFSALWNGDASGYASTSEADMALCSLLAYWTQGDASQMDRLFRQSGLMRDKWERDDYRERTIAAALNRRTDFYTPQKQRPRENVDTTFSAEPEASSQREEVVKALLAGISTGRDLMAKTFAPVDWLVPGIVPEGFTALSGKPKMGKTWMAEGFGLAMAAGGRALGHIECKRRPVLYLALEDSEKRLQSRLEILLQGQPMPERFTYATKWARLHMGGLDAMAAWMRANPGGCVIIDTLAKVMPPRRSNSNGYAEDYNFGDSLHSVALECGGSVLALTHNRKASADDPLDEINATAGFMGAFDTGLVLRRERGKPDAVLHVTGRDVDDSELSVKFEPDTARWIWQGDASEVAATDTQRKILDAIKTLLAQGLTATPSKVAAIADMKVPTVKTHLARMEAKGLVHSLGNGGYECVSSVVSCKPCSPDDGGPRNHAGAPGTTPERTSVVRDASLRHPVVPDSVDGLHQTTPDYRDYISLHEMTDTADAMDTCMHPEHARYRLKNGWRCGHCNAALPDVG